MVQPAETSGAGRDFHAGEVLFREGEAGRLMYVIQEGEVRVSKRIDGEDTTVAQLGPGEFVGEVGVMRNEVHTTTAIAVRATRCLAIDGPLLERMVVADGEIAVRVIKGLADRLAASHELMTMIGQRDSRTRVCMAIIRHAEMSSETTGEGIWIRKRLGDIAEEVAVADTEMGEISKQLMRLQLLRIKRDGILVPDVSRLYGFVRSGDG
jgi:CRP-like cAMP-binding protein